MAALESKVREAVGALSSLIANASSFHGFADAVAGQEESTLAGNAFVVIVGFAVADFAVAVADEEGLVAFFAHMVDFIFTAQD